MTEIEFDKERAKVKAALRAIEDSLCLLMSTDPKSVMGKSIGASCEYNGVLIHFAAFVNVPGLK